MNAEQLQALKDKLVDLRDEKENLNGEIDELVAQKTICTDRRTEINDLITLLKDGLE